jgi:amino acid permease
MDSTSAAFNLVIAAIGCGVLSFPFGFASAGLALGIAFALCFAAVNVWTLDILATACLAYTENSPYRTMVTSAPKKSSRSLNRNLTTSSIAGSMPTLVVAVGGAPPVTVSYEILSTFCTCRFVFLAACIHVHNISFYFPRVRFNSRLSPRLAVEAAL